jgi:hypothetical protein
VKLQLQSMMQESPINNTETLSDLPSTPTNLP